ncbi:hypothetical protein, partial [Escherichia coli]|uniref:hypothetical protein n=1 Tax=Escherichia coli TaxID=562 RepID=UPI001BC83211
MSDWAITYSKDEATERQVLPFPHLAKKERMVEESRVAKRSVILWNEWERIMSISSTVVCYKHLRS